MSDGVDLPVVAVVPLARMRHWTCGKDYESVIAVARVCEICLVMGSAGDVSSAGFEICESLLSSLHDQSRDRHSGVSLKTWEGPFDQVNVSVIDYARVHHHDVNARR